ncbi:MAG: GntR family transcriptional regulator [Defluviitaleaceae bacterium]|nr:GntR family transcriptional regulator [Defluviitaleaceae bacterium]MCL2275359.1 GntR family transcriptional regulator [Defluviitaleaceae bacterium]
MFQIDLKSRKPIYTQVVDNFKRLIVSGALAPDSKVPSVRDMARTLTVNPNTVQKAYRELEMLGYIYTVIGQGSYIGKPETSQEIEALFAKLRSAAQELSYRGVSQEEILTALSTAPPLKGGSDT